MAMVSPVDLLPPVFVEAAFFVLAAVEVFFAVLAMVFKVCLMLSFLSSLAEAAVLLSLSLVSLSSSLVPSPLSLSSVIYRRGRGEA